MTPTQAFIQALKSRAPHPNPNSRPLRIATRGQHDVDYLLMGSGAVEVPQVLETTEEIERLVRERKGVEL